MNYYEVVDNNFNTVCTGSLFECEAWVEEFGWNNEAYYRIRAVK